MTITTMLELADGSVALIDTDDIGRVAGYEWRLPESGARYPVGLRSDDVRSEPVFLHRLIANAGPDDVVIHRNHNTLDNRSENLLVMGRARLPLHPPTDAPTVIAAD